MRQGRSITSSSPSSPARCSNCWVATSARPRSGGGTGSGRLRAVQPAAAGSCCARGAKRLDGAHLRRIGYRQGSAGTLYPPALAAWRKAVHRHQLRRYSGQYAGGDAVRPRKGAFTGHRQSAWQVRAGRWRYAAARRDFRDAARAAGQAVAGAAGARGGAGGGRRSIALDIRVLATTNRDLAAEVAAGASAKTCSIDCPFSPGRPPLRERPADILPLAERLLAGHARKMRQVPARLSSARYAACSNTAGRVTCVNWTMPFSVR